MKVVKNPGFHLAPIMNGHVTPQGFARALLSRIQYIANSQLCIIRRIDRIQAHCRNLVTGNLAKSGVDCSMASRRRFAVWKKIAPVFNDKHLSYNWRDAKHMYDTAR